MSENTFEERLSRVERAADVLKKFDDAELRAQAFGYLIGERAPSLEDDVDTEDNGPAAKSEAGLPAANNGSKPSARRRSAAKKQTFTIDKTLDFHRTSGPSGSTFDAFVAGHKPRNAQERVVVAVYYLKNELAVEQVSVDHIYTAFKAASWPLPSDLMNAVHIAGSHMFLDSKQRADIKLISKGENLVERELPVRTTA